MTLENQATQLRAELAALKQEVDLLRNERDVVRMLSECVYAHDQAFSPISRKSPELDAQFEALFTEDGICDSHGLHTTREGMAEWLRSVVSRHGNVVGIQMVTSNMLVDILEDGVTANARTSAITTIASEGQAIRDNYRTAGYYTYRLRKEAVEKHPDAGVVLNFGSSRTDVVQVKAIALTAEVLPERHANIACHTAKGCLEHRHCDRRRYQARLLPYRQLGSYVSKSGGMSNELNNILSLVTNGTYEGIAIGGDRYSGTSFIDHLLRYEADPECRMLVLLGEVGGVEKYRVNDATKAGRITKPIVAWAIGTCAEMFATEVQFGHAGSMANSDRETADAKNAAMRAAGFVVPDIFEDIPLVLQQTYESLLAKGTIVP
ncbi:unnamed protein product [Rhizoctonia solani]|uniref:ATP citrate synthase n=1 Tax=Rhizoctonia solani TaxID=456999 RepID=A0A8H3HUB6_9AGAM|nr:unnamed protein product [Rhizoctonia solani]